jgi:hypothetical protein
LARPVGKTAEYSNCLAWLSEMLARRGGKPFGGPVEGAYPDPLA